MNARAENGINSGSRGRTPEMAERLILSRAFARLDPLALGVAMGLVCGAGLALATAGLLVKGGPYVGLHLMRLSYYLPGYSVSWTGVFVGLAEGAVVGFALGALLALFWNAYHRMFVALVVARGRARDVQRELQEL